jgi:hypothetical protein
MVSIPPPGDWEERLQADRGNKDRFFKDSTDSPLLAVDRADFTALDYWPPDPSAYFVGTVHAHPTSEPLELPTTAGTLRPGERVGWLSLNFEGQPVVLHVYRLLDGAGGLFLPFRDTTAGRETYGAGRYLDLQGPPDGPFVLDFNRAYNPSCAYGSPERYSCPLTPAENRLEVRIEAGERRFDGAP